MKNISYFLLLILLISCGNNQEVESVYEEALTVEGYVVKGELIKVYLSSNLPFQGELTDRDLIAAEEGTAKVTVSDGFSTEILTLRRDDTRYPNVYYQSKNMRGLVGRAYDLEVVLKGVAYTSNTVVPVVPVVHKIGVIDGAKKDEEVIQLEIENELELAYYKLLIKNAEENVYVWGDPYIFSNELTDKNENINLVVEYTENVDGVEISKLYKNNIYDIRLVKISESEYRFYKSVYGDYTTLFASGTFSENIETNIKGGNDVFGFWCGENLLDLEVKID